jgi:glutamine amidotransferase
MIVVIDYGMGNLGSIANMFSRVDAPARVTRDLDEIRRATKLVLPGVGAFDKGMNNLRAMGLVETLRRKALDESTPVLGICLGMQLLGQASEEGRETGLGLLDARSIRFRRDVDPRMKIPHMGWNTVAQSKTSALFESMYPEPRFYFVHSYHLVCANPDDVLAIASYGYEFPAAVERGNIFGAQFHPEKSHKFGMKLLQNFAAL